MTYRVGVIGHGNRAKGIVKSLLNVAGDEAEITAIADPNWPEKNYR